LEYEEEKYKINIKKINENKNIVRKQERRTDKKNGRIVNYD